jgi:hypothetical protein
MGEVSFQGSAPYGLPAAQDARAQAVSENVSLTLYCAVAGSQKPVEVQMTRDVAKTIAAVLTAASIQAERNYRQGV